MLAGEIAKRMMQPADIQEIKIRNSQDVADLLMNELKYEKREIAKILLLNTKNVVQRIIDLSFGGTNFAMLEPKDVLYEAIKAETPKIIIVHNHPSGDETPSSEDINVTKRILDAAKILGLELLDHVIIASRRLSKCYEVFIKRRF